MANTEQPQFANVFNSESPPDREGSNSHHFAHTDEWDASKTPPSRFQKRKGSIYATPSSRDGHVERNRDAVEEFHKAHSKRWSISSKGSNNSDPLSPTMTQQRRKSTASNGGGNA